MGVVKQEVKMSAGYSGFIGSVSSARQAASTMLPDVSIPTLDPTAHSTQTARVNMIRLLNKIDTTKGHLCGPNSIRC